MSQFDNFTDRYLEVYDPSARALELRYKSQAEGTLTLLQTMELIESLMLRYQLVYKVSPTDKNLIFFPFMFIEPQKGDRILNTKTNETYTVDHIIKDPVKDEWQGLVRLELNNAPVALNGENLILYDEDKYVRFEHAYPTSSPNTIIANNAGGELNSPPMKPSITWFVSVKEPGALDQAFGPRKELKPRLRDRVKDPVVDGYTVEIYGQWFDNIVQFDAWYVNNKATERLIEWFEQFMRHHQMLLRKYGVSQSFFWKRLADDMKQQWRQPVWERSIQYYFRTEQLEAVYQRDLLKIDVILNTATGSIRSALDNKRYIADQLVSGKLTASGYRRLFYDESGNYLWGRLDILQ
jgi:hypothetical protein